MDEMEMMETQNEEYQDEKQNDGIVSKLVGTLLVGAAAGVGGTMLWLKNNKKRKAKKLAKARRLLEENGYLLEEPDESEESESETEEVEG